MASFWPSELSTAAGSTGSFNCSPTNAAKPRMVTSHKAACQPIFSAMSRLSGTPSTTPLAMPPMMIAMALPRFSGLEIAAEAPIPMARYTPAPMPATVRQTIKVVKLSASALKALAKTNNPRASSKPPRCLLAGSNATKMGEPSP
ncbi:hypothetical protein D9M70_418230 [compost metagenome]